MTHLLKVKDKKGVNSHRVILSDLVDSDTNLVNVLSTIGAKASNSSLLKI